MPNVIALRTSRAIAVYDSGTAAPVALPLQFTHFRANNQPIGTRHSMSWPTFCEWIEQHAPIAANKAELPLIKLATFRGDHRSNETLEAIYGVECDYDGETIPPDVAAQMLQMNGIEALVCTTPSHTTDRPRWRVFAPLSGARTMQDRYMLVARLNGALNGILANESFVPSSAYYIGALATGHPVQLWRAEGRPIDTLTGLREIAPSSSGAGTQPRHPLGTPALASPSIELLFAALDNIDPEPLEYDSWLSVMTVVKQAGWSHAMPCSPTRPGTLRRKFDEWSARSSKNNPRENDKKWRSITETIIGWPWLKYRYPHAAAAAMLGGTSPPGMAPMPITGELKHAPAMPVPAAQAPIEPVTYGETPLGAAEQELYFRGCTYVGALDKIRTPYGRYLNEHAFNSAYGGRRFRITSEKTPNDNAWQAATRGQQYQIPKVDHIRFIPTEAPGAIMIDELGRRGVNTWIPPTIDAEPGDVSPWLNHLAIMFPSAHDRAILIGYMAYCVRFPGVKIAWAPLVQSCEGAGKNLIKFAMVHALGASYVYEAKSDQLAETGGEIYGG